MVVSIIRFFLEHYVKRYFRHHPGIKLVVVTGSVGKTGTKRAVATILAQSFRVRMHDGNHNTHLSAPVAMLGLDFPTNVKSPTAWLKVFMAARRKVAMTDDVQIIVQELGSDRPGEIKHFGKYLRPDIAIVTGVTPEHMEFFGDMDTVAKEELGVGDYSKLLLINRDDIDGKYAQYLTNPTMNTYGTTGAAEYRFEVENFSLGTGYEGRIFTPETPAGFAASVSVVGEHSLRPVMAAAATGLKLGLSNKQIQDGLLQITPAPGRMNLIRGLDQAVIIDDSYNSSPAAAAAALQTLYSLEVPQRLAILGSMNELGESSADEHEQIGSLCDPFLLAWVITIGSEAEKYLAPAAKRKGCQVKSFMSAIDAGAFARKVMEPGVVILVKGSEGGIYAEEAVKVIAVLGEEKKLVRQSAEWLKRKDAFFSKFA